MFRKYELRYKKDFFLISSVVTQEVHKYQVGETITMSLMRREKGTTYALPKAFWEKREVKIHDYNGKLSCLFRIYLSVKTNFRRKSKEWLAQNQYNMSEWSDMSTRGLLFQ